MLPLIGGLAPLCPPPPGDVTSRERPDRAVTIGPATPAAAPRAGPAAAAGSPRAAPGRRRGSARCGVCHCVSTSRSCAVVEQLAPARPAPTFDASVSWWNIDSPAKRPPTATPYRPPTRRPSRQVSTECTQPRSWSRRYAVRIWSSIQPDGRAGSAQASMTSAHAVSTRTSKRRTDLRSDRRHRQVGRSQHPAPDRAEPRHRRAPAADRHREQPPPVGRQQGARLEVGTGGDQVVVGVEPRRRREVPDARRRFDRHLAHASHLRAHGAKRRIGAWPPARNGSPAGDADGAGPGLTAAFVREALHRAIHGVGPLPPAASAADKQLREQQRRRRPRDPRGHREPRALRRRPGLRDQPRRPDHDGLPRARQHHRAGAGPVPDDRRHRPPARLRPDRPAGAQRGPGLPARRGRGADAGARHGSSRHPRWRWRPPRPTTRGSTG